MGDWRLVPLILGRQSVEEIFPVHHTAQEKDIVRERKIFCLSPGPKALPGIFRGKNPGIVAWERIRMILFPTCIFLLQWQLHLVEGFQVTFPIKQLLANYYNKLWFTIFLNDNLIKQRTLQIHLSNSYHNKYIYQTVTTTNSFIKQLPLPSLVTNSLDHNCTVEATRRCILAVEGCQSGQYSIRST